MSITKIYVDVDFDWSTFRMFFGVGFGGKAMHGMLLGRYFT